MNTVPNNKATNLVKLMHGWQFKTLMRTEEADDDTDMAKGEWDVDAEKMIITTWCVKNNQGLHKCNVK